MIQLEKDAFFGDHDRYRLIRTLGQGGYSEVWLAEDTKVGLTVALKIYAPGRGLSEDGVTQFSKEFKMVFNLNHANLLRPTHYDVFNRMPYLIVPYCEQGSSSLLTGKMDESMAWKFLHDVASGLAYLHAPEPPVIHLDIKPDNVLIDSSNSFVITDFGISAVVRNTLPTADAKAGTMTYMAPERFKPDYNPIKASDVWALGASLFELMTGKPPFGENGGLAQLNGAKIPVISKEWPKQLRDMIIECLQLNTWRRPTAEQIVKVAKRYLDTGQGPTPDPPAIKFSVILALACTLVFGCAGFFAGQYASKPHPMLHESIQLIEQGDTGYDENDLSTWHKTLTKYRQAKELTEQHALHLPNMESRISLLRKKMDDEINRSIETARQAFEMRSEMALFALKDALAIDPDHEEAKALYEQYTQAFPQRE